MDSVICMIIEIVAILVLFLVFDIVLPAYATKKGETREEKKVKSEVSLIEQRKHNLIEKRNGNLLGVVDSAFEGLENQLPLAFSLILDNQTPTQMGFLQAVASGEASFTSQHCHPGFSVQALAVDEVLI